ncbi:MAG: hypothetical protein J1E06_02340 [Acutalibacter sp.]|nr:hypothetical protein [Acutalibacter sp.]
MNELDNRFYKVDLHVHTPASKCFEGDKSDNGYWEILRGAVKNEVRVIAITDHNTLKGYENLVNLREQTKNEYEIIQKYTVTEEEKRELREKVELFEKIYILLGVEITLNPGVHIIVLCSENEKAELNELLEEIGYTSEQRGSDSDFSPNVDVKTFLANPKLNGKIVYAPHVDSNKGIWNDLKGKYREEIFSTNCINAISCNNSSQLLNIKQLVASQPGYVRKKPFAYINASDAHLGSNVGSKYSFFSLAEFSFEEVKRAFESPEEKISDIERPDFKNFVDRCVENNKSVFVNDVEELPKSICAILNSGYGYVFLGITENKLYSGVSITEDGLRNDINSSMDRLSTASQRPAMIDCGIVTEKLGNGKFAFAISVKVNSRELWVLDDKETYILSGNGVVKSATIKDIEVIVKENVLNELRAFNKRNDVIIKSAMNKMAQVASPISKYYLFDKLALRSIPLGELFSIQYVYKNSSDSISMDTFKKINGQAVGNVFYITGNNPRLDYACLRYSCPRYDSADEDYISKLQKFQGPAIIVSSKGGCHLVDTPDEFFLDVRDNALILMPKEDLRKRQVSLYHAIAWLKSSFFIWACLEKLENINFYKADIFMKSFFAADRGFIENKDIELLVLDIFDKEKQFLIDTSNLGEGDAENYAVLCDQHNQRIAEISHHIEDIIRSIYQISDEEMKLINDDLRAESIYTISPCNEQSGESV